MKPNISKTIIITLFLFVTSSIFADTETESSLYSNTTTNNNVISTSYFKKSGKNENMIPFKKKVKTLDENGVCISKTTYIFDMNSKSWQLSDKVEYTYYEGKLVSIEYSDRDVANNKWNKPQITSYTYSGDSNLEIK